MPHTAEELDELPQPWKKLNHGKESVQRNDLKRETLIHFHPIVLSETSIGVNFTSGADNCFGYRAILEETSDSIGIAVVEGNIPGAPKHCKLLAGMSHFVLHTQNPIGHRKIVPLKADAVKLNRN